MKSSEVIKLINDIETSFPVNKWKINDIHVWPIIRIDLYSQIIHSSNFNRNISKKHFCWLISEKTKIVFQEFIGLLKFTRAYVLNYKKNDKIQNDVDVLFMSNGISYARLKGLWFDKFCDPIRESLSIRGLKSLLLSPGYNCFIPRYYRSCFIQPFISYLTRFKFRLCDIKNLTLELERYDELNTLLSDRGLNSTNLLNKTILCKYFYQILCLADFYKSILIKTKPKFCMQVTYYCTRGYSFNLACNQMGIPCVDIQHGVQGVYHIAYGSWKNVPKTGYWLLPNVFWCWNKQYADVINRWSCMVNNNHIAISGGNLFMNKLQKEDAGFDNITSLFVDKLEFVKGKRNILYSLNGYETSNQIKDVLDLVLDTEGECFWWLRCHPCFIEQKKAIKKILNKKNINNVELDLATDNNLYVLLKYMDLHMTECSSVVLEAAHFNVPSIITTEYGAEHYKTEIEAGFAKFATSKEEIKKSMAMFFNKSYMSKKIISTDINVDKNLDFLFNIGWCSCQDHRQN